VHKGTAISDEPLGGKEQVKKVAFHKKGCVTNIITEKYKTVNDRKISRKGLSIGRSLFKNDVGGEEGRRNTDVFNPSVMANITKSNLNQTNVKVIARLRPLNKREEALIEQGVGNECCSVIEDKAITFPNENFTVSLDHVFDKGINQAAVYEKVGKPTLESVLSGYNGTILAYGQTGTGKTYTMFGPDIYDENKKGVIPRAAGEMFQRWDESIKEVVINCSMLEIYKEELHDLLIDEGGNELKIKEFPEKGIWVEGLSEIPIGCEQELMYWIDKGESRRIWAETCHNSVSSRSHALLMIEVKQLLNNGSEKRGLLNLVDLAGSEKVGRSGVQGELFLEGTKINLSLSALGNVMHALTTKMEHIPYRDSKLTRLLQESLSGNCKTTLVVTCSPYSAEMAESITALKFAQRAKKLKNTVKMNIKKSSNQLLEIIKNLKEELRVKDEQLKRFAFNTSRLPLTECKSPMELVKVCCVSPLPEFTLSQNTDPTFSKKSNKGLDAELIKARKTIEELQKEKAEVNEKIRKLELNIIEQKKIILKAEQRIVELEHQAATNKYREEKEKLMESEDKIQIQILSNQIKALTEALDDSENECLKLLREKKEKIQKDTIELHSLNIIDYIKKSTLQCLPTRKLTADLSKIGLAVENAFIGPKSLFNDKLEIVLDDKKLMSTCKYSETLDSALVEGCVSPETIIYLLKNQLIEASILNHNLQRVISFIAWKLHIEKSVSASKTELADMLEKTVNSLEKLLIESSTRHQNVKSHIEALSYEISQLKITQKSFIGSLIGSKPQVRKPIKNNSIRRVVSELTDFYGSKFLRAGVYTPLGMWEVQREERCKSRIKEESMMRMASVEDDGKPQVAEMDEEDERKIEEEILKKGAAMTSVKLSEIETLGHGLRDAQIDLNWHKMLTDLLMDELIKTRKQADSFKQQVAEIKISSEQVIQDENKNWKAVTDSLKARFTITNRKTMIRNWQGSKRLYQLCMSY